MKNLLKSLMLAASAFVLLAGCNQIGISDATVDGATYSDDVCYLTVSVDNLTSVFSADRSAARTINPVSFEGTDAANVDERAKLTTFILTGISPSTGDTLKTKNDDGTFTEGITLTFTDVDVDSEEWVDENDHSKGKKKIKKPQASVEIPYGSWDLTLTAKDAAGRVLLQGQTFKSMRKDSANAITFILTTDGIDEKGGVNLAGTYIDEGKAAKSYHAGLYNILTGELIPGTEKIADITAGTPEFSFNPKTGSDEYIIEPGHYSFQLKFFNKALKEDPADANKNIVDPDASFIGYWEDDVVVAPGRITKNTSIACKKIINQLPDSPKNLRAYLKDNSDTPDGYTVILTWEDTSKNEENFVITIDEYTPDAEDASKLNKTTTRVIGAGPSVDYPDIEPFFASDLFVGGSIHASSTNASIKLPYGRLFEVSVQAQNFVGMSDADADKDGAQACVRVIEDKELSGATLITSEKINRYAINYELGDGTLSIINGSNTDSYNGIYYDYAHYGNIYDLADDEAKKLADLLTIKPNNTTVKLSSLDGYAWKEWVKADGTSIGSADKLDYKGITVKAVYDNMTLVSYTIDNKYYTITTEVKYDGNVVVDDTVTATTEATRNKNLTFKVTASDETLTITKVSVKISNANSFIRGESTTDECIVSTKNLDAGNHTVIVTAVVAGKVYQNSFPLVYIR